MVSTSLRKGINLLNHERVPGRLKYSSYSNLGADNVYTFRYGTMAWDYGHKNKIYIITNQGDMWVIDLYGGIRHLDIGMSTSSSRSSCGEFIYTSSDAWLMYHRYNNYFFKVYPDWDLSPVSLATAPTTSQYGAGLVHTSTLRNANGNDDYIYWYGREESKIYRYSISGNSWTTIDYSSDPNMSGKLNLFWNGAMGWDWHSTGQYLYLIVRDSSKIPYLARYNISTGSWDTPIKIHNVPYYLTYSSTYNQTLTFDGKNTFFGISAQNASADEENMQYCSRMLYMIKFDWDEGEAWFHSLGRPITGYPYISMNSYQAQWICYAEIDGVGYIYYTTGVSELNNKDSIYVYRACVEHLR